MGTHPIFESDFDCLTEQNKMEFPDLGKHCAIVDCNKLDFLPFKCLGCQSTYCLDHYTYERHNCANPSPNSQVPTCPLCSKPVPLGNRDLPLDQLVSEHIDRGCDSALAAKKRAKKKEGRCCAPKCKTRELIKQRCDSCVKIVCLKHRFPSDHECVFLRNNGLNENKAMERAIAVSMNGQTNGRTRLEEAQMKQQETIDQALAQRLHRQEVATRERAARELQRYQQQSSKKRSAKGGNKL